MIRSEGDSRNRRKKAATNFLAVVMSLPTNMPSDVRRLHRLHTGRATPLDARHHVTDEERSRQQRAVDAAREALENIEPGMAPTALQRAAAAAVAASAGASIAGWSKRGDEVLGDGPLRHRHIGGSSRADPDERRRRGVNIDDARGQWMDRHHRSERRTPFTQAHRDMEYDSATDRFQPTPMLRAASATPCFTDAERSALRGLASAVAATATNHAAVQSSAPRQRQQRAEAPSSTATAAASAITKNASNAAAATAQQAPVTPTPLRDLISHAIGERHGVRHAPVVQFCALQAPRGSASALLHGTDTNAAGHHRAVFSTPTPCTGPDATSWQLPDRRCSRAPTWRAARDDIARTRAAADDARRVRDDAVESTKRARSLSRALDPMRDVDYFLRRDVGIRICKDNVHRSASSTMAQWLFAYPPPAASASGAAAKAT